MRKTYTTWIKEDGRRGQRESLAVIDVVERLFPVDNVDDFDYLLDEIDNSYKWAVLDLENLQELKSEDEEENLDGGLLTVNIGHRADNFAEVTLDTAAETEDYLNELISELQAYYSAVEEIAEMEL